MKRIVALGAIACLLFTSCASTPTVPKEETETAKKLQIVVTIAPLASFAKAVGGDLVEVHTLVPVGISEHTWEPKPSDMRTLHEADMVIKNGLALEPFLEKMLQSREAVYVVDTSKNVEVLHPEDFMSEEGHEEEGHEEAGHEEAGHEEEGGHHDHGTSDPHIWLSPKRARIQVQNIAEALVEKDPLHQETYRERAKTYDERLQNLEKEIDTAFAKQEKKPFIVFHDAYQYYLKDFGLLSWRKGAIQSVPGKEPSPAYLQELTSLLEKEGVNIIFVEPQFSQKTVEVLEQEYNIHVATIDPIGRSLTEEGYEENMRAITQTMITAFTQN